jgi:hypothetical protein
MNGRFQKQGGKNWILPKEIDANRFSRDSMAGNLENPLMSLYKTEGAWLYGTYTFFNNANKCEKSLSFAIKQSNLSFMFKGSIRGRSLNMN